MKILSVLENLHQDFKTAVDIRNKNNSIDKKENCRLTVKLNFVHTLAHTQRFWETVKLKFKKKILNFELSKEK